MKSGGGSITASELILQECNASCDAEVEVWPKQLMFMELLLIEGLPSTFTAFLERLEQGV